MAELPKRATLIVNAGSRSGRDAFEQARGLLERGGVALDAAIALEDGQDLCKEAERAVAEQTPMLIVGGGDGSLSSAVDYVAGTDTVFGVLPLGTANSFARSCSIPLDLPGAVDVLCHGRLGAVDLGMLDDDYFCNFASIGLAPQISSEIPHALKQRLGRLAYAVTAASAFRRFEGFRLLVDGESMDASEVRIANGAFQGGTELVEDARVESGQIIVQVVLGRTRFELMRSYAATLLRRPKHERRVREFRRPALRLATEPPLPISVDGEVCASTPVTVKVAPAALRMALPLAQSGKSSA